MELLLTVFTSRHSEITVLYMLLILLKTALPITAMFAEWTDNLQIHQVSLNKFIWEVLQNYRNKISKN